MDIRTVIQVLVDKTVDGVINYSGEDKASHRNVWVNLMTDRIIGAFHQNLPAPIDLHSKYELHPVKGLHVRMTEDPKENEMMMEYLAQFANDNGWNDYRMAVENMLYRPYSLQKDPDPATIKPIGDKNG